MLELKGLSAQRLEVLKCLLTTYQNNDCACVQKANADQNSKMASCNPALIAKNSFLVILLRLRLQSEQALRDSLPLFSKRAGTKVEYKT